MKPACPYCDPLFEELAQMRAHNEMLQRMIRVDAALARQLSRAMAENVTLRASAMDDADRARIKQWFAVFAATAAGLLEDDDTKLFRRLGGAG